MAATGISERVGVGPVEHGHATPTSFWALTLGSIGVVYGDIGTSPLYALKESLAAATDHAGATALTRGMVLGVVSLILWTLIIIVTIKYVAIVLRADNNGEGGTLSLVTLAQRALGHSTGATIILGMVGASLFYGDVIITPAISVLSAVEGLKLVTPAFEPYVVPLSLVILITLFAVQRFGTASVASFFGPITAFWFLVMAVGGLMHIRDDLSILAAINPVHGLSFLLNHGTAGLLALGAVFLSVTGAEALYADMGHFGRAPIRTAWLGLVLPALALNYLGQGAMLLAHPEGLENPFFLLYPSWALLPMVILATVATIIASQAVITGAFSISEQAMHLGVLPRFHVMRTSETEKGQIYIPTINWLLLAAVIVVVVLFESSSALAAAYGLAVTGDMVITSCLLFIVAWKFWRWSPAVVALVIVPFLAIELVFLGANALKIPHGGWFPLLVGTGLFILMRTWRKGTRLLAEISHRGRPPLTEFIRAAEGSSVPRVPGTAIFLTGNSQDVPAALLHNLKHNKVLHDHNVILTVVTEEVPRLQDEGRVTVETLSDRFSRVVVRFGFMESPNVPKALEAVNFDLSDASYFLSRRALQPSAQAGLPLWQDYIFIPMARSASDVSDQFCIPEDQAVEVGARITI
ncbi:potassium transporter Kup (plasmid) [Microvirga ossetica]|uniref:Probable potassium transport system protein Kup n=1 Tax=Microvirga ossetica TaxID=1882682 RepID=A0A1B2EXF4_9HYPH|nr:potassium transporter Kup [Microvirga ossetica]ANY84626.1 potassium transporter Kup [Microvirga ossetica]